MSQHYINFFPGNTRDSREVSTMQMRPMAWMTLWVWLIP